LQIGRQLIVVDTQDARQIGAVFRRCAQDDFLAAGGDVAIIPGLFGGGATGEESSRFDDDVDVVVFPRQLPRITLGQRGDFLTFDGQRRVVVSNVAGITPVNAVIFEQRGQSFVVGQVVDGNDFEFIASFHQVAKGQTSDSAEAVNCYSNSHCFEFPCFWWRSVSTFSMTCRHDLSSRRGRIIRTPPSIEIAPDPPDPFRTYPIMPPPPHSQADSETDDRGSVRARTGGEADRTAWRRPPGVSTGTWRYAHEGAIASRYDDFVAATPLCCVDLTLVRETFPGPNSQTGENVPSVSSGSQPAWKGPPSVSDAGPPSAEKNWILDLGCGTGRASELLADAGYDVVAIDLSLPMLREVTRRNVEGIVPLRANLVQLDCLGDQTASGAVCLFSTLGMIQGRSNRREFLHHVRRIVKPGGRFLLHVHHRYAALTHSAGRRQLARSRWQSWWQRNVEFGDAVYPYRGLPDMFLHQFSRRELSADLNRCGWKVRSWQQLSIDGSSLSDRSSSIRGGIAGGFLVVIS